MAVLSPDEIEQMIVDYGNGIRSNKLAERHNRYPHTILKELRKHGVNVRARSGVNRHEKPRYAPGPEPRCPGKTYAEYLADAARRGSKAAQAELGGTANFT